MRKYLRGRRRRHALAAVLMAAGLCAQASLAHAGQNDPSGRWTTIDDATGKPKSMIEITVSNGVVQGTIIKAFLRQGASGLCDHCNGTLKDRPIVGMPILQGVKQDGDQWDGGSILDPGNGDTYDVRLRVLEGGQKLEVRGYMGISLLGRTQIWLRAN